MHEDLWHRLQSLTGTWQGEGRGQYPTIESFHYREKLRFDFDPSMPLMHYEQRTWLLPENEPSHWESGFFRVADSGRIEVSNAQDGGRVEVIAGHFDPHDTGHPLVLDSLVLEHDPRMIESRRVLRWNENTLHVQVFMKTHTTDTPRLQLHLEAELTRTG